MLLVGQCTDQISSPLPTAWYPTRKRLLRAQRKKNAAARAAAAAAAAAAEAAFATQDDVDTQSGPTDTLTATPAAPVKPKSWAELFASKNQPVTAAPPASSPTSDKVTSAGRAVNGNGAQFDGIADVLHKYKPSYSSPLIQPRGLVNNGNMCFMNAVRAKRTITLLR